MHDWISCGASPESVWDSGAIKYNSAYVTMRTACRLMDMPTNVIMTLAIHEQFLCMFISISAEALNQMLYVDCPTMKNATKTLPCIV